MMVQYHALQNIVSTCKCQNMGQWGHATCVWKAFGYQQIFLGSAMRKNNFKGKNTNFSSQRFYTEHNYGMMCMCILAAAGHSSSDNIS